MAVPVSLQKKIAKRLAGGATGAETASTAALKASESAAASRVAGKMETLTMKDAEEILGQPVKPLIPREEPISELQSIEDMIAEANVTALPDFNGPAGPFKIQSRNADEAALLFEDVIEPEYATQVVMGPLDSKRMALSRKESIRVANVTNHRRSLNPRSEMVINDFMEGSPYKMGNFHPNSKSPDQPWPFYRVDRETDPAFFPGSKAEPVQFFDPRESGLHLGSTTSARVKQFGAAPDAVEKATAKSIALDTVLSALTAKIPPADRKLFRESLSEAIEGSVRTKFAVGRKIGPDVSDIAAARDDALDELDEIIKGLTPANPELADNLAVFTEKAVNQPISSSQAYYFNGKNPLYLPDNSMGWTSKGIIKKIESVGLFREPGDRLLLNSIKHSTEGEKKASEMLRDFLETRGFDHIGYSNSIEDTGSYSVIAFRPEQILNQWDKSLLGASAGIASLAIAEQLTEEVLGEFGRESL